MAALMIGEGESVRGKIGNVLEQALINYRQIYLPNIIETRRDVVDVLGLVEVGEVYGSCNDRFSWRGGMELHHALDGGKLGFLRDLPPADPSPPRDQH
jgi:hypothetical protein